MSQVTETTASSSSGGIKLDVISVTAAFGLASIISYIYVVTAGRTLSAAQFGVFNTLLGLITISGFFASSLQLAVAQAAALHPTRHALDMVIRGTYRIASPGIVLLVLVAMPFASKIGATPTQVAACGAVALAVFLACAATGFLLGVGRVRPQAGINLLGTIVQLGVGWTLMQWGLGVTGALLGYLSNYAVVFLIAHWGSSKVAMTQPSQGEQGKGPQALRIQGSSAATFVLAFCPFSLDQLLVQTFAPSLGGSYAVLATMAKPVFYSALPIISVAYSHLLRLSDSRSGTRLIAAAAVGVACVTGVFAMAIAAFPAQLTEFLFLGRFADVVPYLGSMAFGVACFSVTVLCTHTLIALRRPLGFLPSLIAIVVQVGLYAFRHDSLADIVSNQLWTYGTQLSLILLLLGRSVAHSLSSAQRRKL